MLEFSSKIAIYMLLVSSGWDHTQPRPIEIKALEQPTETEELQPQVLYTISITELGQNSLSDGERAQRQVVAPKRFNQKSQQTIDSRVHVTAENLREAEEIRKAIQKTIDEDTFAVDTNQPASDSKPKNTAHHPPHKAPPTNHPTKSPPTNHPSKSPPTNHQTMSPTSEAPPQEPKSDEPKQTTDNNPMNVFGQHWLDLFEHSRSLWSDGELWSEIKSHWFDLIDNSQQMWTADWF